jgi:hypothetical protein
MMWEYDLPRGQFLRPDEATTAEAWQRTEEALDEYSSPSDHDELATPPNALARLGARWRARLRREW